MSKYYIKQGRKYVEVQETPRMYADGVWLVQRNGYKKQHIAKIGEIVEIFPFANLMQNRDILADFLYAINKQYFHDTVVHDKEGGMKWTLPSNSQAAKDIILFLSLSESEQKAKIKEINESTITIDADGTIRNVAGQKVISKMLNRKSIENAIQKKTDEIEKLKRFL